MFLPPLTTFVTRLIETTWSFNWNEAASSFLVTLGIQNPFLICNWKSKTPRASNYKSQITNYKFLELQSRFARRIGHGFDPAMVDVAATIEHHFGEPFFFGQFGNFFSHHLRRGHVAPGDTRILPVIRRRSRRQGYPFEVVDQLHVHMVERK